MVVVPLPIYVVDLLSPYNVILGKDWLIPNKVIYSSYHLVIKLPTKHGVAKV